MKVFVYGTLKEGGTLSNYLKSSKLLGKFSTLKNYTMINLGWFPGVLKEGNTSIQGEVYEISGETLQILDRIEGYPTLYTRKQISTPYGDAWIYLYNSSRIDRAHTVIPDGVWAIN